MIKHSKHGVFLLCALLAQQSLQADYWKWRKDPADPKAAERIAEQTFEKDLKPHDQVRDVKDEILRLKVAKARIIKEMVERQHLSPNEAKQFAEKTAHDQSYDLALAIMFAQIEPKIKQLVDTYDKQYTQQDLRTITDKVKREIVLRLQRSYTTPASTLQEFTKPDYTQTNKIERMAQQEVAKLPDNFKDKYFTENDITEIYPEHKVSEMRQRIEQNRIWREKECSVCTEKFSKLGKRVNLECGHGNMCAKCATLTMHVYNNNHCPSCRAPIDRSDFSIRYLKSKTNDYDLGLIKKLDPEAYKRIMDLFKRN